MRQRDVAALDAKYHEVADAKAENDALRDDVAAGRRRLHIKAVCQSVREATTASAWIMQPPPTGRHRWTGLFHPRRGWSLCKNNWKEPRSILSSADRVAHIRGATHAIIVSNTHALPAEYKCLKVIKPSNPFTNVCWVSVLAAFSAPPQILAASTVFFTQFQKQEKWWVMVPLVLLLPVCFEQ